MKDSKDMTPSSSTAPARVVLCTRGGLAGALVLKHLLSDERINVVAVVLSTRAFRIGQTQFAAFQFACRQFGLRYLIYLLFSTSLADALLWWRREGVRGQARRANIPIIQTSTINAPQIVAALHTLQADIILSAFFNQIISADVARCTSVGAFNIHPALLPRNRGVDPVFYGRLRGEATFGVTLHRIADAIDEGNIISQAAVSLSEDHIEQSVLAGTITLYATGGKLFSQALAANTLAVEGIKQTDAGSQAHYDSWPHHADVAALNRRGHVLWRWRDLWAMLVG
jgi:methionyl-tRNA formyltransferase